MNKMTKKEALEVSKTKLSNSFKSVNNYGKLFVCHDCYGCVLRDLIYSLYRETGLAIEVFSISEDKKDGFYVYFVGSREHVEALKEAIGGTMAMSDTSYFVATPEYEAWTLGGVRLSQLPSDQEILDILI